MDGDDQMRHCRLCKKNVYDLSSMTRAEAEKLLLASIGDQICVRFHRRADGKILTSDCHVGRMAMWRRMATAAAAGVMVLITGLTKASNMSSEGNNYSGVQFGAGGGDLPEMGDISASSHRTGSRTLGAHFISPD